MSSSGATSPMTADSPAFLTPATASTVNKPLAPTLDSNNPPTISLNKTWVLPPKPKPGRKPAVDTPPTKRKAQNREAQRAFRERRAAKVGELEEEMKKMEEEHMEEQNAMKERIKQLERNVQNYGEMIDTWRCKFDEMQMAYEQEKRLKQQASSEADTLRRAFSTDTAAIPLPTRTSKALDSSEEQQQQSNRKSPLNQNTHNTADLADLDVGCGKCNMETRCQCIEEAFELSNVAEDAIHEPFKRPPSNLLPNTDIKRVRRGPDAYENTEIDFTAQFSTSRPPNLVSSSSTASSSIPATAPQPDPCGFCSDGTLCICAEMAKENSHQNFLDQQTSESQSTENSNSCPNGPGTCAQCLSNPTSTMFCKSVASYRSSTSKNDKKQTNGVSSSANSSDQPRLTCADAFTTLSRHPGFSAATDELNTWVPQLTALPKLPAAPERTAFDIEAASVMSVLKLFDRRFGADGGKLSDGRGNE